MIEARVATVGVSKSVKYGQFRGGRQLMVAWRRDLAGPGAMRSTNETDGKLKRGPAVAGLKLRRYRGDKLRA